MGLTVNWFGFKSFLTNTTPGHDKFYELQAACVELAGQGVFRGALIARYGKRSALTGDTFSIVASTEATSAATVENALRDAFVKHEGEKLAKGYVRAQLGGRLTLKAIENRYQSEMEDALRITKYASIAHVGQRFPQAEKLDTEKGILSEKDATKAEKQMKDIEENASW